MSRSSWTRLSNVIAIVALAVFYLETNRGNWTLSIIVVVGALVLAAIVVSPIGAPRSASHAEARRQIESAADGDIHWDQWLLAAAESVG